MPLLAKDDVKEALFDALGHGTVEQSNRLGAASYEVILRLAAALLELGSPCIVEANFSWAEPFARLPPARVVQVLCSTAAAAARYASRVRHPGHVDQGRTEEVSRRIADGEWGFLDIGGERIAVDTTDPVDVGALALRILD